MSGHLEPIGRFRPESFCEEEGCWASGGGGEAHYCSHARAEDGSSASSSPPPPPAGAQGERSYGSLGSGSLFNPSFRSPLRSAAADEHEAEGGRGAGGRSVSFALRAAKDAPVSNTLKLMFFICGLSTFARSESILMQTQMYAKCFGLGSTFYPSASSAMFMPGILIQLVQNKCVCPGERSVEAGARGVGGRGGGRRQSR